MYSNNLIDKNFRVAKRNSNILCLKKKKKKNLKYLSGVGYSFSSIRFLDCLSTSALSLYRCTVRIEVMLYEL